MVVELNPGGADGNKNSILVLFVLLFVDDDDDVVLEGIIVVAAVALVPLATLTITLSSVMIIFPFSFFLVVLE